MFTAPVKRRRARGFTLLEIILATTILAMMCLAVYRFVQGNITVLRVSSAESEVEARYSGLINLLRAQWQNLPAASGALMGEPFKFNDVPRDEITWVCGAGPGLLTRYAPGEFTASLRLRPVTGSSAQMEIGLMRKPRETEVGSTAEETWIPLVADVRSLEIRYFDTRLNSWVERWTDTSTMPRLIRLVIGRPDRSVPWEAIIALGRTPL